MCMEDGGETTVELNFNFNFNLKLNLNFISLKT